MSLLDILEIIFGILGSIGTVGSIVVGIKKDHDKEEKELRKEKGE